MLKQQLGRLTKKTLTYGVGQVLNRFITFLLLPVFTAYLTPSDYGIISILLIMSFLLLPVFSLGFGAATGPLYFEGNNQERKETTTWTAFTILLASTCVLSIFGFLFPRQISDILFQTPVYGYLVTLTLLDASLDILTTPSKLYLQFEERAGSFVTLSSISTLLSIGLTVIMVVFLKRGVQGIIEGRIAAQLISFTLFSAVTLHHTRIRFDWSLGRELLGLGIPLIPAFFFVFVLQHGNKYLLQLLKGLDALGIYTVGFSLGLGMNIAVSAFQAAWYPYFMSFLEKRDEARALFGRILTYYVFGFGGLSLMFYIAAKPVVMLMTQPSFHQAYKVVGLSATAQFLTGIFYLLLPGMYFAKQVKYMTLVQGIAALVAVGVNLLVIPVLGFLGAGIALMIGFLTMVILQHVWNLIKKNEYINVQYEWKRVLWFSLINTGFMVLSIWERNFSLLGEILLSGAEATLLSILLYILLNTAERKQLWAFIMRMLPSVSDKASFNA